MKEVRKDKYYEYIECPICGKKVQRMKSHLGKTHKLSWDEFHNEYPDIPNISGKQLEQRQRIMIKNNNDPIFRAKVDYANHNPSNKKLKSAKNNWKNWNNSTCTKRLEQLNKISKKITEYNKSEKHIKVVREMMLKRHENPEYTNSLARYGKIGNRVNLTLPNGRNITTRSQVEANIISELSKYTSNFDYECISIKYNYNNIIHSYLPDILLQDDIILEIKPYCYWEDEVNQIKKKACEKAGYKFYFLFSIEDLHKILSSATTIETIL